MYGKVVKALDAVTVTGAGSAIQFDTPVEMFSFQVTATGSPSTCSVNLEGSLDGVTWFTFASNLNPPEWRKDMLGPANFVRANVVSLSGGTSPTVTAWVAGA